MSNSRSKPAMPRIKSDRDWEIDNDVRTLKEAASIMEDKKRFTAALKRAKEEQKDLDKLEGLRKKR
jgi:hypothetical protein